MNEKLLKAIRFFTEEKRIMDGMTVAAGEGDRLIQAREGREISDRSVYDLASVTKLFTGLCLMRLWELGSLDLSARIPRYAPAFDRLGTVTVEQLMAFQVTLRTPERIDGQETRERGLACLRAVEVVQPAGRRFYSDIPAMVLKYVVEGAAGLPLYDCIRELILQPADMAETWARVPVARRQDCLLYGPEYRIEKENWMERRGMSRGIPHDPKAALLQGDSGDLCGHAGLFSTEGDMIRFCRAVLSGVLLRRETLAALAVNRTGREYPDGSHSQYLGYLCYVKHPDQYYSEIPATMSHAAFGIAGFTGNHVSIDPIQRRFTLFLGNRVRDRLTVLIPEEGKTRQDYGLHPDGSGVIRWLDGRLLPSSVDYVHQKDRVIHRTIDSILWMG